MILEGITSVVLTCAMLKFLKSKYNMRVLSLEYPKVVFLHGKKGERLNVKTESWEKANVIYAFYGNINIKTWLEEQLLDCPEFDFIICPELVSDLTNRGKIEDNDSISGVIEFVFK